MDYLKVLVISLVSIVSYTITGKILLKIGNKKKKKQEIEPESKVEILDQGTYGDYEFCKTSETFQNGNRITTYKDNRGNIDIIKTDKELNIKTHIENDKKIIYKYNSDNDMVYAKIENENGFIYELWLEPYGPSLLYTKLMYKDNISNYSTILIDVFNPDDIFPTVLNEEYLNNAIEKSKDAKFYKK